MSVKAMFYVNHVGKNAGGAGVVKLNATTKGDYKSYSQYTPTGTIEFTCLNDAATQFYMDRLGKDVVVRFDDPTEDDLLT